MGLKSCNGVSELEPLNKNAKHVMGIGTVVGPCPWRSSL